MNERQHWSGQDLVAEWQRFGIFRHCEATNYEKHMLWQEFSKSAFEHGWGGKDRPRVEWRDGDIGTMHIIKGKHFNTCVSLYVDVLEGKAVLFWECTSIKADFDAARNWIEKTFKPKGSSNPMNFHHIIHDVRGT